MLLESPIYHGLATHDEAMIAAAKPTPPRGIDPNHFEFQMLYGVRRDLQRKLVREGYNVRVYVPFGASGIPTSCAAWPSARPMCSSSPETSSAPESSVARRSIYPFASHNLVNRS